MDRLCVDWNVHCSSHEGVVWPEGSAWHQNVVYGKTFILSNTVLSKHLSVITFTGGAPYFTFYSKYRVDLLVGDITAQS